MKHDPDREADHGRIRRWLVRQLLRRERQLERMRREIEADKQYLEEVGKALGIG